MDVASSCLRFEPTVPPHRTYWEPCLTTRRDFVMLSEALISPLYAMFSNPERLCAKNFCPTGWV